jgi:hypothetical protein
MARSFIDPRRTSVPHAGVEHAWAPEREHAPVRACTRSDSCRWPVPGEGRRHDHRWSSPAPGRAPDDQLAW